MRRVIIVGSINRDVTIIVDRHPQPGETLTGRSLSYGLGGKGANQAAAAAHAGAQTLFVGAVGDEAGSDGLRAELSSHGVDVSRTLIIEKAATGTAFITVTAAGENTIVLDPGANALVTAEALDDVEHLGEGDVVVLQGEIPEAVNAAIVAKAAAAGATSLLNLAPAYHVDDNVLRQLDILVVNESEAGLVLGEPAPTDVETALDIAQRLLRLGPGAVMVTLGGQGAVWAQGEVCGHVPALRLGQVVDTTGAGDACVGVLAAALAATYPFPDAVAESMRGGAVAVLSPGAAASYAGIQPLTAR